MQTTGHYRKRGRMTLPGQMNLPRRGRVGKMMPSMKKMSPAVRRG